MISIKRVLAIMLMVAALCWGLCYCQEARADWVQTGSLLPGTYKMEFTNHHNTAQLAAQELYAMRTGNDNPNPLKIFALGDTYNFIVKKSTDENATFLAEWLNGEPVTDPSKEPNLFRYNESDDIWVNIPLPCKWQEVAEWPEGEDLLL